jgi:hypothetical protein
MTAPPSRSGRWVFLPVAVLLLLGLAWTGGWFYAARRADGVITAWLAREAADGRTYDCGERTLGGYPFRIEVRCREPSATLRFDDGPVVVKARDLIAVSQVYQPDLVIAEVTGPLSVAGPAGEQYAADWRLLQLSARGRPDAPERVSIVVDAPKVDGPAARPVGRAQRLEVHLRKSPDTADGAAFDLALRASGATLADVPSLGEKPLDAEALAVLKGPADLSAKPLRTRLRAWQAAGGRLELKSARLAQADSLAVATGAVGLTPEGRLDGGINVTLAGLDRLATALLGEGNAGRSSAGLLAGLALLGRTELEGRRAIAVPLRFRDGRVFFGPIPIADTPAFY